MSVIGIVIFPALPPLYSRVPRPTRRNRISASPKYGMPAGFDAIAYSDQAVGMDQIAND
jgi:hypothetical protein